jgi:hypothetical protein
MRRTPARRELAFVVAVAVSGLALVLVVVFAPWYPPATGHRAEPIPGRGAGDAVVQVVDINRDGVVLTP